MSPHPSTSSVRHAVDAGTSYHLHYRTSPTWPLSPSSSAEEGPVNIAVLDSSFNPPTSAHIAIASAPGLVPYNALLFLLASVNADKGSSTKPGHPDVPGKVEMMCLVADILAERPGAPKGGVGVATTTFPFFADKSRVVVEVLSKATARRVRLHWLVGWDTVIRIFEPKYYVKEGSHEPPTDSLRNALRPFLGDEGDGSSLVAFRRGDEAAGGEEARFLERDVVKDYVAAGKLTVVDVPNRQGDNVSSTDVRVAVKDGRWHDVERMTEPAVAAHIRKQSLYTQ